MESEADCSMNSPESFARWDQDTLSWKTFQRSFLEEWATYSEPWPRSGMTVTGTAYLLPTFAHRTSGTGFSYFATPTATANQLAPSMIKKHKGCRAMIPTPITSNAKGASKNRYRTSETYRRNLSEWVRDSEDSGQLSPTWTEWLMGFPLGWTDLDA